MSQQLSNLIEKDEQLILQGWLREQIQHVNMRKDLISEAELRDQSASFLRSFKNAVREDQTLSFGSNTWKPVKDVLEQLTRSRTRLGFSPSETASFVLSLKTTLFKHMRNAFKVELLVDELVIASEILDRLGLYTTEVYQKSREEVIRRQQNDMLELSTPVVELAESIIALPLIGTLDSNRAQTVMEVLLERIVATGSEIAIIDITGVPTVDTLVAQHLMKTVAAARLMGADCIISGIRPQIAQTIVQLGIDMTHVHTKASLADAFKLALKHRGLTFHKTAK